MVYKSEILDIDENLMYTTAVTESLIFESYVLKTGKILNVQEYFETFYILCVMVV